MAGLGLLRRQLPEDRRGLGLAVTAGVAAIGLAAWVVPVLDDIDRNPRDGAWNAVRAYLSEHDDEVERIVTDDRDALVLGIYVREPVGGGPVVHARSRRRVTRCGARPTPTATRAPTWCGPPACPARSPAPSRAGRWS